MKRVRYSPRTIFVIVSVICLLVATVLMLLYVNNAAKRTYIDLSAEYGEIFVGNEAVRNLVDEDFIAPISNESHAKLEDFVARVMTSDDVLSVTVWDREMDLLVSSEEHPQLSPKIIEQALSGEEERISLHSEIDGQEMLHSYIPVRSQGRIIAVIEVHQHLEVVDVVVEQIQQHLWNVVFVTLPLILFIFWFGFYGSMRKIEERHRELKKLNKEYGKREKMLTQANRKLQHLDELKDELLHNTSHELRTPLSAIKAFSEFLLDGDMGKLNKEQHESVKTINEASVELESTITNLLDLSRLEAGTKLTIESTQMTEIVEPVVRELQALVPAGVKLQVHIPQDLPEILCDIHHTKGVLKNLIGNSIKFTKKGSITVSAAKEGKFVKVSVKDTGLGIKQEAMKDLFKRYFRTKETTKIKGSGLGLNIVKKMIERQGGEVSVTSTFGKGSTFSFTIPT